MSTQIDVDAQPLLFKKRKKHRLSTKARLMSLDNLDGRTFAAKNCLRLIEEIRRDVGTDLSAAQGVLATRAAVLATLAEHAETQWLQGQPIVIGDYSAVCNTLRRILKELGVERKVEVINSDSDSDSDDLRTLLSYFEADDVTEGSNTTQSTAGG